MTLVELMISMLILAIVCVAWLEIIGIQSAKKEARRREAVERLAGMMDAFMYIYKTGGIPGSAVRSFYLNINPNAVSPQKYVELKSTSFTQITDQDISKPFADSLPDPEDPNTPKRNLLSLDPLGYRLVVVNNLTSIVGNNELNQELFDGKAASFVDSTTPGWANKKWLIGLLYNGQGKKDEAGKPFFRLPVCLGL